MEANPFGAVTIGSTVDMSGRFGKSVLSSETQITTMVTTVSRTDKSMRGQSDLVYTTHMKSRINQHRRRLRLLRYCESYSRRFSLRRLFLG